MLRFRSLGSGSTGNAALVETTSAGRTSRLLVDCGFGLKQLDLRLAQAGLVAGDIDAVFVTHEHGDHIGCAHSLARRNRVPARGYPRAGQPTYGQVDRAGPVATETTHA